MQISAGKNQIGGKFDHGLSDELLPCSPKHTAGAGGIIKAISQAAVDAVRMVCADQMVVDDGIGFGMIHVSHDDGAGASIKAPLMPQYLIEALGAGRSVRVTVAKLGVNDDKQRKYCRAIAEHSHGVIGVLGGVRLKMPRAQRAMLLMDEGEAAALVEDCINPAEADTQRHGRAEAGAAGHMGISLQMGSEIGGLRGR